LPDEDRDQDWQTRQRRPGTVSEAPAGGWGRSRELLRDQIVAEKEGDERTPIVIVGNKTDVERRRVDQPTAETTASIDWGTGYVEVI